MSNHQHTLIVDGTSGISGDMTVAALLDLGASEEHLERPGEEGDWTYCLIFDKAA